MYLVVPDLIPMLTNEQYYVNKYITFENPFQIFDHDLMSKGIPNIYI